MCSVSLWLLDIGRWTLDIGLWTSVWTLNESSRLLHRVQLPAGLYSFHFWPQGAEPSRDRETRYAPRRVWNADGHHRHSPAPRDRYLHLDHYWISVGFSRSEERRVGKV